MDAVEVRFVPKAGAPEINGPFGISEIAHGFDEGFPVAAGARWRRYVREHRDRVGGLGQAVEHALRGCGSDTGQQMQKAKPGDAIARIFGETQQRQHVLDVSGVEKLQSTEFYEWDVPTRQFDFERTAVARCPKQHGLLLEERSGLAILQDTFDDEACQVGFIAHRDELRLRSRGTLGPEVLGKAL